MDFGSSVNSIPHPKVSMGQSPQEEMDSGISLEFGFGLLFRCLLQAGGKILVLPESVNPELRVFPTHQKAFAGRPTPCDREGIEGPTMGSRSHLSSIRQQ